MSLQVWLPLIDDIKNQGLADIGSPSRNTLVLNSEGKLGSCYTGGIVYHFDQQLLGNKWTVATWVKNSAWSTANDILACVNINTSDHCQIYFSIINGKTLNLGINGGASSTGYSYTFNTDEWYHVAASYDGLNYALYINGDQVKTGTITAEPYTDCVNLGIGYRASNTAGTSSTGGNDNKAFNDFRLYDHALSPLEIKRLSQGLMLHYPLSYPGNENLIKQSYYDSAPWATAITEKNVMFQGKECIAVKHNILYNQNIGGNRILFPDMIFEENTQYTMSIEWGENRDDTKFGNWYIYILYTDGTTSSSMKSGASHDLHKTTLTSAAGKTVQAITTSYANSGITYFRNFKIEKGTEATIYAPAPEDMGFDDNIEYDVSGYKHNGVKSGVTYSSDTPRYYASTYFDGLDDMILIQNLDLSNVLNNQCTISFWIKPNGEGGYRSVYFSAYSGVSWSLEKNIGNSLRSYWNGNPDKTVATAIADDVWCHIVVVKNGQDSVKVYKDGILQGEITATHSNLNFATTWRIGRDTRSNDGTPYCGLMSDFRIYATAFSADEVLSLYNTPISLSSNATLLTQAEYSEV